MSEIQKVYDAMPKSDNPDSIVIFLHGLGSNGQDLISLAPYFAGALNNTVFVSPDAPFACDMVPAGYPDSYQWFSLQSRDPQDMLRGVQEAWPILNIFIEEQLKKYDLSASKCVLCGFSQGTMMSLYAAASYDKKLAGILGYSGALLWETDKEIKNKPPVHLIHGQADDVVPVQAYQDAKMRMEQSGFSVTGHTTPMLGHSIDGQGIESGAGFISSVLSQ